MLFWKASPMQNSDMSMFQKPAHMQALEKEIPLFSQILQKTAMFENSVLFSTPGKAPALQIPLTSDSHVFLA